jgi:hypothetical protein
MKKVFYISIDNEKDFKLVQMYMQQNDIQFTVMEEV